MLPIILSLLLASFPVQAAGESSELVSTAVLIEERSSAGITAGIMPGSAPATRTLADSGGGSSSIGTDAVDVRTQTAWFYGAEPITTCYQYIESFGPTEKLASQALESAAHRWQMYFAAKKVTRGKAQLVPDVNFKLTGKCKGNEDLVIYFGTGPIFGNSEDLKAAQRLSYPAAYANKVYMTRDLKWSRGYIRVVGTGYYGPQNESVFPDWRVAGSLDAVMTHELGHVLGFIHTPGTVMQAELAEHAFSKLGKSPVADASASAAIDGVRELVTCDECQVAYHFAVDRASANHSDTTANAFFNSVGIKPSRKLTLKKSASGFELADGVASYRLSESSRSVIDTAHTLLSNFKEPIHDTSESLTIYSYITYSGHKFPMILEINSPVAPGAIVVRALDQGEIREIGRFN